MIGTIEYIPQFLFDGIIREVHTLEGKSIAPYWQYDTESVDKQAETLKKILHGLPQEEGIVAAWFVVEDTLKMKHMVSLQQQLEDRISSVLGDEWEADVFLIPGSSSSTVQDYILDVEGLVHTLSLRYPFEHFAQIVGFGNYAPFQALFLEGMKQFENRYTSIYWNGTSAFLAHTEYETPADSWAKQFRDFIAEYDYQAALKLLEERDDTPYVIGLRALLQSIIDRLNFAFSESIEHLEEACTYLKKHNMLDETMEALRPLLSHDKKEKELARIAELYRQLEIYLETNDMASFLVRFYRAREAVLLYLMQYGTNFTYKQKKQSSIYGLVDELEQMYDEERIERFFGAYFYLRSSNVAKTLNVRNNSFIGHGRAGVTQRDLWHNYYGTSKTTLEKAKRRFLLDSQILFKDLGIDMENKFSSLNRYILKVSSKIK
ncbi:hypothetical protein [Bacillus sp. 165]|uniref:hypothetical protein n=1 Tax=Bacillus sp. 165 TaxID=1529117 RepID=UPI001ADA0720|nr:hypothetical protein [Bacillus sp. 165]MBO9129083.1 hypothetical protein [Bacillus sp. 165]